MVNWQELHSKEDESINYVLSIDKGYLEARWVQRTHDYAIIYVSSHNGCNLSCRFCHLTALKQVMNKPATLEEYVAQVKQVLKNYDKNNEIHKNIKKININFMSRGDALTNPVLLNNSSELFYEMERVVREVGEFEVHFLISSIIPNEFNHDLVNVLSHKNSHLYYSLYSMEEKFRKRWLPKAMNPYKALDLCKDYQLKTGKRINLHWAFIEGENDSEESVDKILEEIKKRDLRAKFNLVRYNPFDNRRGTEPDFYKLEKLFNKISESLGDSESRIVPRVGYDVKASCGMFVK